MIVYATDSRYAPHATTSMYSVAESWEGGGEPPLFILDCGLTPEDRRKISSSLDGAVNIIEFDYSAMSKLPQMRHFGSAAAYARLGLDSILPSNGERLLYVDADTLAVRSLHDYASVYLETNPIGAVLEVNAPTVGNPRALQGYDRVGVDGSQRYFNSGVLIIDRSPWRAGHVGQRCLDFVKQNAAWIRYPDQDALNAVAGSDIFALDPSWNVGTAWDDPVHPAYKWFGNVPERARIFHFVGPWKPWQDNYANQHVAEMYAKTRAKTAYRETA
ncbi:MAG: glycosyltransferase family 8 protein [Paenarthrobacter ureafaciens]|uniref:glycosyltransferase family 8 protein n=1 Tax=Paenarthrobacter ureafaciens TaxID=37931 RepID=UPI001AC8910E|nr:glycosyltransferase family 8 protein [Paenarthrobacter ureafaciens]MBN9128065.1 glycosyltransferase family 8 protein [Paenarthrobacter ureafaciens]